MNNSLIKTVSSTVVKYGTLAGAKLAKHSPTILVATGIGSMAVAVVHASKLTLKADVIVNTYDDAMAKIEKSKELNGKKTDGFTIKYTEKDESRDIAKAYILTGKAFIKHYWMPIAEFTFGAICVCVAHRILNKRVLYLAASYNGLLKTHNSYRENIRNEYGEEADIFGMTGAHNEPYTFTEVNEDGSQVERTEQVRSVNVSDLSDCAVFFDEQYSDAWTDNALTNLKIVAKSEEYYNHIFGYKRNYILWSDVLIDLGIWNRLEPEKQRLMMGKGWVYDPALYGGDNPRKKINFGIIDWNRPIRLSAEDAIMGYEPVLLLDPNIDGDVASLL